MEISSFSIPDSFSETKSFRIGLLIVRFFSVALALLVIHFQCTNTNPSYKACERADLDYLACSLVIYQAYAYCSERASALSVIVFL
ncbi:hypothetical protein EHQ58_08495 [Leptospira ognonensis]|uniref:Uncharacterized protein n=1 Tax=Leptospira ognonensis TaxID=2484945 RepID=A0A4R9K323_9LEPT|nr:hypothetical protein EHQ58_08495 [Leptospira ognonensis]